MEATVLELRDGLVAVWAPRASAVRFAGRGHHLQRDFTHPAFSSSLGFRPFG